MSTRSKKPRKKRVSDAVSSAESAEVQNPPKARSVRQSEESEQRPRAIDRILQPHLNTEDEIREIVLERFNNFDGYELDKLESMLRMEEVWYKDPNNVVGSAVRNIMSNGFKWLIDNETRSESQRADSAIYAFDFMWSELHQARRRLDEGLIRIALIEEKIDELKTGKKSKPKGGRRRKKKR